MKNKKLGCLLEILLVIIIVSVGIVFAFRGSTKADPDDLNGLDADTAAVFNAFLAEHKLALSDYPPELLELLATNPETEEFVLNYPLLKNKDTVVDLAEHRNSKQVPLLMQWDTRWGYRKYGSSVMGISGCGPTCLSMVAVYLLNDTAKDPAWMAAFSTKNGYCVPGNGTSWTLMSEGAGKLGLKATELPLDKNRMVRELEAGNPIICVMGPGDFTTTGHFIVLTGIKDGKFTVNDPNSAQRSRQFWSYEKISGQIRNIWAFSKK